MPLRGEETTATEVYNALISSIANVYRDVMTTGFIDEYAHRDEYKLFNNPHRVVDGPCYAFLVHGKGPAVGGVGFAMTRDMDAASTNVNIANNNIENVVCFTNEVPASVVDGIVQNDARGAIVQLVNTFTGFLLIRIDPPTDPLPFVNGKKNVTKRVGRVWFLLRRPRAKKSRGRAFPTRLVCPS